MTSIDPTNLSLNRVSLRVSLKISSLAGWCWIIMKPRTWADLVNLKLLKFSCGFLIKMLLSLDSIPGSHWTFNRQLKLVLLRSKYTGFSRQKLWKNFTENPLTVHIDFVLFKPYFYWWNRPQVNPHTPVAQKVADELVFRRFQGEEVESF